jgi:phosphoenolpyruvate synthase/pyruvate phosphate dikinase
MDVADVVRPHEQLIAFLEQVEADGFDEEHFLDALAGMPGGPEARDALVAFLERYGMRCVGEIDVTRPRWAERPTTLVPTILTNVRTFAAGAAGRRFEEGRRQALAKREEVLERLRALPDGERKVEEAAQMIDRVRTFAGYREYPKYGMVCRYFVYKQALMAEADRLVAAQVLSDREDIFFLRLEELADIVRGAPVDPQLLRERKDAFREHQTLTPPRVFTSDGEVIAGVYRRDDLPDGALAGLAVSAGTVEGRARVVLDISRADLDPGDILVTAFTDPSWTPLFIAIRGLVTEVGGLMTHGAVIAREYGLPAVVGVEGATRLIQDGQRVRLNGTDGYVELLERSA